MKTNFQALETTDRFLKDAVKGAGFTFNGCIAEFIDNSIDAAAKKIIIKTFEIEKDLYDISIEDDGKGIPMDKIYDVIKKIGYGKSEDYASNAISNFGLGAKFAIINLCSRGETKIRSVNDGKESIMFLNNDDIPSVSLPTVEDIKEKSSTLIYIPNVKASSNQITVLSKFLGGTYFPHIHNGNELNITIFHKNKEIIVEFTDPLYRQFSIADGVVSNTTSCEINGYNINILSSYYDKTVWNENNFSFWDIKSGGNGFTGSRSGIYFRLGGRYITLGEGEFFQKSDQQIRNHLRIEVEIDRELISLMGIGFNKSKITIDKTNDQIKEFLGKLDQMVSWGQQALWKIKGKNPELSQEQLEYRSDSNKDLNARRRKNPLDLDELPVKEMSRPKKETPDDSKGTKERPSDIGPYDKSLIEFREESNGKNGNIFEYWKENKKLVIIYNIDHEFYSSYYSTLTPFGKKMIDMMVMSFSDAILMTKFNNITSVSDNDWESELLTFLSLRLKKYSTL